MRTNITKRKIRQLNREGKEFVYDRYILHYRDPHTGKRRMKRFETRKSAEHAQNALIRDCENYYNKNVDCEICTLEDAVSYWLKSRKPFVQKSTLLNYQRLATQYIIGPMVEGSPEKRARYSRMGKAPKDEEAIPMLGAKTAIKSITTSQLRLWLNRVMENSTPYITKVARKHLSAIFRLIEEDFEIRLARIPSQAGVGHRRKKRELLNEKQIRKLLTEAENDKRWGIYYAFPLLTGARPGEHLSLMWSDVDFDRKTIRICRTQTTDGEIRELPKTDAGIREVPMNDLLYRMLLEWKERCPKFDGKLHRVFPGQGFRKSSGSSVKGGRPFTLSNYRNRVWAPVLDRLGLPRVSPYACRHMVISYLQSQGIEVGMVAKIAGHANPQVTLSYYTHAVTNTAGVMDKLDSAYGLSRDSK